MRSISINELNQSTHVQTKTLISERLYKSSGGLIFLYHSFPNAFQSQLPYQYATQCD